MKTRNVLVLAALVWATPSAADLLPVPCEQVVIPASATRRQIAELMRQCTDALDALRRPAVRGTGREFAASRELGPLRLRRSEPAAGPLAVQAASLELAAAEPPPEAATTCALGAPGSASLPTSACLQCHARHGHPVGLDYAASYGRAGWSLRTAAEVVRRGVLLPEGRMECVTCHDGSSQWKSKIALPPGAPAFAAVVAGRQSTYPRGNWRMATATSVPPLPPGSSVSPAPLCAACHTMAD